MRPRITLGRFLVRLGEFLQTLPVVVMKPDDLMEATRRMYAKPKQVKAWGDKTILDSGLRPEEETLLEKIRLNKGSLLLMGVGGGREAIRLAKTGFDVTGLDFVPEMVKRARENAAGRGVHIHGIVQDISMLDLQVDHWDVVWLSTSMYSCVPTRKRRVEMLKSIRAALKPGGLFICRFHWNPRWASSPKKEFAKKLIAWLTLGNIGYQKGDLFWNNVEFLHAFSSVEELRSEFAEGRFDIIHILLPDQGMGGGAVLRKDDRENTGQRQPEL